MLNQFLVDYSGTDQNRWTQTLIILHTETY